MFHELERHTAASLLIDPETGLPPDISPDGHRVVPSPEATARARRRPLCRPCAEDIQTGGAVTFSVRLTGEQSAVAVTSEQPLVDDEGRVMVLRCPLSECGAVVDLVEGQFAPHLAGGRTCQMSGVQVVVDEG